KLSFFGERDDELLSPELRADLLREVRRAFPFGGRRRRASTEKTGAAIDALGIEDQGHVAGCRGKGTGGPGRDIANSLLSPGDRLKDALGGQTEDSGAAELLHANEARVTATGRHNVLRFKSNAERRLAWVRAIGIKHLRLLDSASA